MLTKDILFGMNILTPNLGRLRRDGAHLDAEPHLSTGLMSAGTALVVGLYAGGGLWLQLMPCRTQKRETRRGEDAGAQEQATADGRSVSGRPRDGNRSAAPGYSLAPFVGVEV